MKLGKHKVYGFAYPEKKLIELDKRLKGKKHLEILTHETLHILFPDMEEKEIINKSIDLINVLWGEGYRKVDNSNEDEMQDGKK